MRQYSLQRLQVRRLEPSTVLRFNRRVPGRASSWADEAGTGERRVSIRACRHPTRCSTPITRHGWSDALVSAGVSTSVSRHSQATAASQTCVDYVFCRQGRAEAEALLAAVSSCEPDIVHLNRLRRTGCGSRTSTRPVSFQCLLSFSTTAACLLAASVLSRGRCDGRWPEADAFLFTSLEQSRTWAERGYVPNGAAVFDVLEASTGDEAGRDPEEARAKIRRAGDACRACGLAGSMRT
jgi:hypothetical protein